MWERIEKLMKERNCRMADVAKGSGISYSTLTDWKAGRYTPKIEKIMRIATFFEVSPAYIMGKIDDPHGVVEPKTTIYVGSPEMENRIYEDLQRIKGIHNAPSDKPTPSYDADQIAKALELYEKYKKAIPQIQAAVESLLESSQSDS